MMRLIYLLILTLMLGCSSMKVDDSFYYNALFEKFYFYRKEVGDDKFNKLTNDLIHGKIDSKVALKDVPDARKILTTRKKKDNKKFLIEVMEDVAAEKGQGI